MSKKSGIHIFQMAKLNARILLCLNERIINLNCWEDAKLNQSKHGDSRWENKEKFSE